MNSGSLQAIRQQFDDSQHEMVNMLSRQMGEIFNPLIQNTNANNQELVHQMGRLATVLGAQNEIAPLPRIEPIPPVAIPARGPVQPYQHIGQSPLFEENEGEQPGPQNVYMHGFNVAFANRPHFVSAFTEEVLEAELPRGWKVPKFTKFSGDSGESTVEHVARYQIEAGDLAINENLKMKYFPSSLTKFAFTWFTTLAPRSVHTWTQLERIFHEQFFRGECKVSLKDLANVKRRNAESIDDYLNRFRMLKSRCFTHVPEHELVVLAASSLEYSIRKKLDTQYIRDMSQLADRVRHVELLKAEKNDEKAKTTHKWPKKEKVAYIDTELVCPTQEIDINDINLAELQPGDPCVCKALKPYENKLGEESPKDSIPTVKTYTFDVTKCDAIYDILVSDGLIVCVRFSDLVQGALDSGRLKYGEKTKGQAKVDSDPLQKA
ncbi:uncharacterized protein LOC130736074 [Lotus japonicus]|uniref:uncharacterized protein LOC130736074 n=1 Tax=Lotus japonicus TaxID=34305 RepID=UPI002587D369|nr:uncharacterized protein LOC130736074 [Lotus japonicus]